MVDCIYIFYYSNNFNLFKLTINSIIMNDINNNKNWGYSTPIQKRLNKGDICKISNLKTFHNPYKTGEEVEIVETGRHDYLVKNGKEMYCVYEYELILIKKKRGVLRTFFESIFK